MINPHPDPPPPAGEGELAKLEVLRAQSARKTSNFAFLPPFPAWPPVWLQARSWYSRPWPKRSGGKGA